MSALLTGLGTAFAAGMATGVFGSWDSIGELAAVADRTGPDAGTAQRHGEMYGVYRSLYPALIGQQHTLARFA
jgi:xylulokinase